MFTIHTLMLLLNSYLLWFGFMVFNATFNNISYISWRSVLLGEETGVIGENQYLLWCFCFVFVFCFT